MGKRIPLGTETTQIVFFNYSLCCLPSVDKMIEGLDEVKRVLIPQGILVNFYPYLSQSFLFSETVPIDQLKPHPVLDGTELGEGFAFKNAVALRGFKPLIEEFITLKSHYPTIRETMEKILSGRSENYLRFDHVLNYPISKLIGSFIFNHEKPEWFPFGSNEFFTLICQIFVKNCQWTKN